MPPLNALDTWNLRSERQQKLKPKSRCFLVAEGSNTEYWYLSALVARLAKRDLPKRIELRTVERTGVDKTMSNPKNLADQARAIAEDREGTFGFDADTDQVVIVFDADIYKNDPKRFARDLEQCGEVARVAVTYPSFELFLLLHSKDAVEKIILPHEAEILENGYYGRSKLRYVAWLANQTLGLNTKRNANVALLAETFEVAVEEERKINQDPVCAVGRLTSNIAAVINELVRDGSGGSATREAEAG